MGKTKNEIINSLLFYMNCKIEDAGHEIDDFLFFFLNDQEDAREFTSEQNLSTEEFLGVINSCVSRKYIRYNSAGTEILLTEEGQQKAIELESLGITDIDETVKSCELEEEFSRSEDVEKIFTSLIKEINSSDATVSQKQEVQKKLRDFLTHPLVNTILGASAGVIASLLGN